MKDLSHKTVGMVLNIQEIIPFGDIVSLEKDVLYTYFSIVLEKSSYI